jgi:putative DNA primase/helicase
MRHWISDAKAVPIEAEIMRRGIRLAGKGKDRSGPCPMCGGDDRFSINTVKRVFNCRGCKATGDVIALVQFLDNCNFNAAVETLTGGRPAGPQRRLVRPAPAPVCDPVGVETRLMARRQSEKANWLWRMTRPAAGTIVERYVLSRGITAPLPSTVRFLPPRKAEQHPAMIVPFGIPAEPEPGSLAIADCDVVAVQLVLLKADGSGKADIRPDPNKLTIGSPGGLPLVVAPLNDLLGLAITEGIEEALSVHQSTGLGAWAAGSAPFLPALADAVPLYTSCITIVADRDPNGQRYASELGRRLGERKLYVEIIPSNLETAA